MSTPFATLICVSVIFGLTYLALAIGRVPGLRLDRPAIAMIGAAAMLAARAVTFDEAARAVDFETIVLLFAMMVLVAYLQAAGLFALATDRIARHTSAPLPLLAAIVLTSGILSAFLVNDVVCVALTPLVVSVCRRLNRPATPYLIGLATASNVGSVATITGNPQNIIIGSLSGISYARFAARLAPVAAAGLVLTIVVVALVYRQTLMNVNEPSAALTFKEPIRVHRRLLRRGLTVTLITIGLFFTGAHIATVALVAAAVLMTDRLRPDRVYRAVDWPLLVMFAGLFVVVHAFEVNVVRTWDLHRFSALSESPIVMVSALSVVLSNIVSNVPAVLLFEPLIDIISSKEQAWLALAMSSTLAGNLTLLGSVANLIVAESARRSGEELGFLEYLKVGVPLTVVTTLVGVAWLSLTHY